MLELIHEAIRRPNRVGPSRRIQSKGNPLSRDQVRTLLVRLERDLTRGDEIERRTAAIVSLCLSGLRISEATSLHVRELVHSRRIVRVRTLKGGWDREIPITDSLARELKRQRDGRRDGWLITTASGNRVDPRNVRRKWVAIERDLGLPHRRLHDLRHTAATWCYDESGHDLLAVSRMLGHRSLGTTAHYVHRLEQLRDWLPTMTDLLDGVTSDDDLPHRKTLAQRVADEAAALLDDRFRKLVVSELIRAGILGPNRSPKPVSSGTRVRGISESGI